MSKQCKKFVLIKKNMQKHRVQNYIISMNLSFASWFILYVNLSGADRGEGGRRELMKIR